MSKDFPYNIENFGDLLAEECSWQVVDGEFFSVRNMTDDGLSEAIVNDVLMVTFFEKEGHVVDFTPEKLIRYLKGHWRAKVLNKLQSKELSWYFTNTNGQLRIRDDRNILQAAMDYAGVVYGDYEFTDKTAPVIAIDHETVRKEIEKVGGLDNFIQSISMDLISNTAENISKH